MPVSQRCKALVPGCRACYTTPRWIQCFDLNFSRLTATGLLNCIRALGGYTSATSPGNLFDTEDYVESEYYESLASQGRLPPITLNWYGFSHLSPQIPLISDS